MDTGPPDLTRLLNAVERGDVKASDDLLRLVYAELRRLAGALMANTPPGQTLQATALVHEVYLRLVGKETQSWENRGHFFFAAGRAMRDILVERARSAGRLKRGGGRRRVDFENLSVAVDAEDGDLLALDEAMQRMESEYPWEHRIVTLRFFAGMTNEETASAMSAPLRTIERDWRFARAWLHQTLNANDLEHSP
ncbi:MAG: RNA polymerase subunit sigma [Planctomycetes bacterium]|nr:RNA polymerase subunit sigma [Planctomycetota bacterium]MBI3835273.1 RNA polymerase subunit sigma [Planctomycetota bacterium]